MWLGAMQLVRLADKKFRAISWFVVNKLELALDSGVFSCKQFKLLSWSVSREDSKRNTDPGENQTKQGRPQSETSPGT